jgi:hypothetical protein
LNIDGHDPEALARVGHAEQFARRRARLARLLLSSAVTTKATINPHGLPDKTELHATEDTFFTTFGWPGAKERMQKLLARGIGKAGEFEMNLGRNSATCRPLRSANTRIARQLPDKNL